MGPVDKRKVCGFYFISFSAISFVPYILFFCLCLLLCIKNLKDIVSRLFCTLNFTVFMFSNHKTQKQGLISSFCIILYF